MKLGIMQPYFFPYLGYFDLINKTDRWVVFDVVQYTPKTWMNRNRILHPTKGWQYVTVPVARFERFAPIHSIVVKDVDAAHGRIKGQLAHYRKKAPCYEEVCQVVDDAFARSASHALTDLNVAAMQAVCDYLGIGFRYEICSRMDLALPEIEHPGQWALEISAALGAASYVNAPGGKEIFRSEEFARRSISLGFSAMVRFEYECPGYEHVSNLSILDVLMWNRGQDVKGWLDAVVDDVEYVG